MNKRLGWFIIILLMATLGLVIWYLRSELPIEKILPAHPLVYARLSHVEDHIDQLVRSDFGKSLQAIDLPDVLARNNFSPRDIREFQRWQTDLVKLWNNPLMKRFLGKQAAIAVYRNGGNTKLFIVLRLTLSTRIAELIGQLSNHWADDVTIKQQSYHGRVINHLVFKGQNIGLAYVRIRDLLVLAPESLDHLGESVDIFLHHGQALEGDPSYNLIRKNTYPGAEGLVIVNVNSFLDLWRGEKDPKLTTLGYQAAAFPVYGLSYMPGKISKFKMLIGLDQKYMPTGLRKVFSCQALTNDTMKFVPVDAIAYNWGGCYDFTQSWVSARQHLEEYPQLAEGVINIKHRLERHFHVSIKQDVLPLLDNEIGGYLTDVDMEGTYPFPRLLIFVKIKDRAKVEGLLEKFTQNPRALFQNEKYNNVNIYYISLPMGANMDPGYGFLGDYLLISTTRQLLKRSIDAYNNSLRSIVSDDLVEQFSLTNGSKFNSVTLMKTGELSRRAEDFLGWMDKYLSSQVNMAASYKQDGNNKKQELDEAIADKSAELLLAQKKIVQLKNIPLSTTDVQDPDEISGAIANLNKEEASIRDDIASITEQKADLSRLLDNYALGAQSAKLTMYNMDNIITPVLKGLESIDAQVVTVRFKDKMLETEFLVK